LKIAFDEFEWGFVYRRLLEGAAEDDPLWTVGRVCLWPNAIFTGTNFGWRVPVDDENTLCVTWVWEAVPQARRPFKQERIPYWTSPIVDSRTGRLITSHVANQDIVAWVGQGRIADRGREHLGESDRGIILMRKRLMEEARAVAEGREPKAVLRDTARNGSIALPMIDRERLLSGSGEGKGNFGRLQQPVGGFGAESGIQSFFGQPAEVRAEYRAAMGLDHVGASG
jgi:5,5'-dehydrodivanillate O-demethylase